MSRDFVVLVLSYVYLFAALGGAEWLRRRKDYTVEFTRKVIHIAAGMTAYFLLFFERRLIGLIPPVSFVLLNAISYWRGTFQAMETGEPGRLGTIYFPLSFSVLAWLLWDRQALLMASLMPMTWGDALAAVVGRRWGRRCFWVLGTRRSLEGSLTFLLVAWVTTWLPLALLPVSPFTAWGALGVALAAAAATALVEALSPWGIDNLTVPAISALVLILLAGSLTA